MIFVFTNKEDSHPTHVIQYLNAWGVPVFRLNTECLLTDYRFSWWANEQECDFHIRNIRNGLELFGHQFTAIWDRRPEIPKELPITNAVEGINKFNLDEAHGFLSFIRYYLKDVYSIGSIVEDRPAASKMLQLSVARTLGMSIPDTCFSNEKKPVCALAKRYKTLSLKQIGNESVFVGDEYEYVFYSQKVESEDLLLQPDESFTQTASFIQNYVEKTYELRITVINQDIIACKIDSQAQDDDKGKIDWRQGYDYNLKHEIVEIPERIRQFCLAFLEKMKLHFGCFDFIVTPKGEYVFLECNPNGQWLWIELETGYDISKVLAENLCKYETKRLIL